MAQDAVAAVHVLQAHPEVNPRAIGLWGFSEGGWVAPIAAADTNEVAFIVLVGASGVAPARQHAWYLENQLRRQGVSESIVRVIARTGVRLIVATGLFGEADHDPVAPLERVEQPVLALWGEKDVITPPAESARIVGHTLERSGNAHYTMRFFSDAEHGLYRTTDGFVMLEDFTPGYITTVVSWVNERVHGQVNPLHIGQVPQQARLSRALTPFVWWKSVWVQLIFFALPTSVFALYLLAVLRVTLMHWVKPQRKTPSTPVQRMSVGLASAGLTTQIGFFIYFGYLNFTEASAVGPVFFGRPLIWLLLQLFALVTTMLLALLIMRRMRLHTTLNDDKRIQRLLLIGSGVFVVWAGYWGLLIP